MKEEALALFQRIPKTQGRFEKEFDQEGNKGKSDPKIQEWFEKEFDEEAPTGNSDPKIQGRWFEKEFDKEGKKGNETIGKDPKTKDRFEMEFDADANQGNGLAKASRTSMASGKYQDVTLSRNSRALLVVKTMFYTLKEMFLILSRVFWAKRPLTVRTKVSLMRSTTTPPATLTLTGSLTPPVTTSLTPAQDKRKGKRASLTPAQDKRKGKWVEH